MRYTLHDRQILRWVMDHPGCGVPFSIRSLAAAAGLAHHSLIGHLLTGERPGCGAADAHAIAEALGVGVRVLFAPPASPNQTESARIQDSVA